MDFLWISPNLLKWYLPLPLHCHYPISFEKAYWKLEPRLPEEFRDLAASTLRSVALNYIHRKCAKPPQTLLKAIHQLRRRDDIVVTKPDKGSGVVVMDKEKYLRLLADASINNVTKFRIVKPDRPKCRGRPPKHYHPLLQKEKELESLVRRILPTAIAESVCPSGSRLAHLYGLPKTHKKELLCDLFCQLHRPTIMPSPNG